MLRSQPPTGTCGFNPKSYPWKQERHRPTPASGEGTGASTQRPHRPGEQVAAGRSLPTPPAWAPKRLQVKGGRADSQAAGARGRVSAHTRGHVNAPSSPTRPTRNLLSSSFFRLGNETEKQLADVQSRNAKPGILAPESVLTWAVMSCSSVEAFRWRPDCRDVEQGLLLGTGTKRLPSPFSEEIHDLRKRQRKSLKYRWGSHPKRRSQTMAEEGC